MNSNQSSSMSPPPLAQPTPQKKQASTTFAVVVIGLGVCIGLVIATVLITNALHGRPNVAQTFKPDMPITITYRKSLVGEAYVAQFFNRSDRHLVVIANCENPTLRTHKAISVEIGPRATVEIGWAEGWKFVSGDRIRLSHADYADESGRIP